MKNIKIIEVKSELGGYMYGASLGIEAMKIAASSFGSDFFKKCEIEEIKSNPIDEVGNFLHEKELKGTLKIAEKIAQSVKGSIEKENFPIVLSSDHSTSLGTISGIKMAHSNDKIAVIWIDAHADIHSPYTTPSWNTHGMPLAATLNEDNLSMKINEIYKPIIDYWEQFKNIGGICPKIYYTDLVYFGLRDYEKEEDFLLKKNNVCVVSVDEILNNGIDKAIEKVLNNISECDYIYVSFDVDSLDPSVSIGTGLSVPNGITDKHAEDLILRLMQDKRICCLEITEVNPTLEKDNKMAETAFKILEKAVNRL